MTKKPPETVDRFRVSCDVPPGGLESLMAALIKMGMKNLHYELITDVLNYKRRAFDTNAREFLRQWIADHATFTRAEVVAHFKSGGRTEGSGSTALERLCEEKLIKPLGGGNYQRADVKALTAPKKPKAQLNRRTGKPVADKQRRYDVSNMDFVLARVRSRKKFTSAEIENYFKANGRQPQSVSPVLNKLIALHKVKRLSPGQFTIVKGKPRVSKPKLNGAAAPTAEVAANG